jgi:hypothetical protein
MLRRIVIGVVAAGLALGMIEVQPAQSRDSCQVALAEAKNQLKSKNVRVVQLNKFDMSKKFEYSEYPEKYPVRVSITIEGFGTESVMNSTIFLKALSSNIILGCGPVSLVDFGVNNTDYFNTFGLLGRDKVEEFECLPAGTTTHVPWGYVICL